MLLVQYPSISLSTTTRIQNPDTASTDAEVLFISGGILFRSVPQSIVIHTGIYKQRNGTEQDQYLHTLLYKELTYSLTLKKGPQQFVQQSYSNGRNNTFLSNKKD